MTFSTGEKLKEVLRELNMRRHVYPQLVGRGKLRQEEANRRINILEEIAADLRKVEASERLI